MWCSHSSRTRRIRIVSVPAALLLMLLIIIIIVSRGGHHRRLIGLCSFVCACVRDSTRYSDIYIYIVLCCFGKSLLLFFCLTLSMTTFILATGDYIHTYIHIYIYMLTTLFEYCRNKCVRENRIIKAVMEYKKSISTIE